MKASIEVFIASPPRHIIYVIKFWPVIIELYFTIAVYYGVLSSFDSLRSSSSNAGLNIFKWYEASYIPFMIKCETICTFLTIILFNYPTISTRNFHYQILSVNYKINFHNCSPPWRLPLFDSLENLFCAYTCICLGRSSYITYRDLRFHSKILT